MGKRIAAKHRFVDPRNGKPISFASERARDQFIADMVRAQKRLIDGKTVVDFEPNRDTSFSTTRAISAAPRPNIPARPLWSASVEIEKMNRTLKRKGK